MTTRKFERLYSRLTTNERFRLSLEAAAREDLAEMELLSGSTPEQQRENGVPEFFEMLRKLHILALDHAVTVRDEMLLSILCFAFSFRTTDVQRSTSLWFEAEDAIGRIAGLRQAWRQFCAELSLSDVDLFEAFELMEIGYCPSVLFADRLEQQPDEEVAAARLDYLSACWGRR